MLVKLKTVASAFLVATIAAFAAGATPAGAQGYNWSGLYLGTHAGGAWSDMSATAQRPNGGFFAPTQGDSFAFSTEGFVGGVHGGYQYQFGPMVLGGELSISGSDLSLGGANPFYPATDDVTMRLGAIFAATVRVGVALNNLQVYVKGGYAGADIDFKATSLAGGGVTYGQDSWHNGWTIGTGVEWAFAPNLTFGVEYNYYDFGSVSGSGLRNDGGTERYRLDAEAHAVTARINWRFGGYDRGPAVMPGYTPYK